jgi:hypothetical protein
MSPTRPLDRAMGPQPSPPNPSPGDAPPAVLVDEADSGGILLHREQAHDQGVGTPQAAALERHLCGGLAWGRGWSAAGPGGVGWGGPV